jgi:hypothetical protein
MPEETLPPEAQLFNLMFGQAVASCLGALADAAFERYLA